MNESMKWLDEVRGNDSIRETARKIGTTHSTLTRQATMQQLSFETVRDIARAYGRPVIADLITLGHLTHDDAGIEGNERALRTASESELVLEVARRLNVSAHALLLDAPITEAFAAAQAVTAAQSEVEEHASGTNVARLDDHRRADMQDERAVASETSADRGEDTEYE